MQAMTEVDARMRQRYVLRHADDTLVLSQQLGLWCGKTPILEEDIALANVALDLLGQARLWLTYAAELAQEDAAAGGEGTRKGITRIDGGGGGAAEIDEDRLAFFRDSREFFNLLLVEQPAANYADLLMRQFLFDAWQLPALTVLERSTDAQIAAIAGKSRKEAKYHLERSRDLVIRLGGGTTQSHRMMQASADALWPYVDELFLSDAIDTAMVAEGIGFDPAALAEPWRAWVGEIFSAATLRLPETGWAQRGGRQGLHNEYLGHLLAAMQSLPRSFPGAHW